MPPWNKGDRVQTQAFNPTRTHKILRRGTVVRTNVGRSRELVEVLLDTHRLRADNTEIIAFRPEELESVKREISRY